MSQRFEVEWMWVIFLRFFSGSYLVFALSQKCHLFSTITPPTCLLLPFYSAFSHSLSRLVTWCSVISVLLRFKLIPTAYFLLSYLVTVDPFAVGLWLLVWFCGFTWPRLSLCCPDCWYYFEYLGIIGSILICHFWFVIISIVLLSALGYQFLW